MHALYMHFLIRVCSWCIPLAVHLLPVILPHFAIEKCYKQLVNSSMVNKLCMCRAVWLLSWHTYLCSVTVTCALDYCVTPSLSHTHMHTQKVSPYVGWLLFTQCREIARIGGHTLPR